MAEAIVARGEKYAMAALPANPTCAPQRSRPPASSGVRTPRRAARLHAGSGRVCEGCGAPARVRILRGYRDGRPVRHAFCLSCAEQLGEQLAPTAYSGGRPTGRVRLSSGAVLIFGGLLVVLVGLCADYFGVGGHPGMGWLQQAGLATGLLLVGIGALLRVDVLNVAGALCVGLAALADVLGSGPSPGIGWRQQLAIGAGLALVMLGLVLRHRRRTRGATVAV